MSRVWHMERAAGVDLRLVEFLRWWDDNGPHDIVVDPKGGVRQNEAEQLELYRQKRTKAQSLAQTPHGRGGAIDCHPCTVRGGRVVAILDKEHALYVTYGKLAEQKFGLQWGGHFPDIFDGPHLQVRDWRQLPFPPR